MRVVKPDIEILSQDNGFDILKKIELVGRTCYKSEDKITDTSCINFVKNIIKRGHEAVIEHYNLTVRFTVDRGISHEIVRHRIASYAQESTRYCNYSKDKFNNEIVYTDIENGLKLDPVCSNLNEDKISAIYNEWINANLDAEDHYNKMIELGASPQIARSVLNNSTKTELCMTANLREWRHFLKLRTDKAAHSQMREVAIRLLLAFKSFIPVIFDDIVIDEKVVDKLNSNTIDFDDWCEKSNVKQITLDDWISYSTSNVGEIINE